MGYISLVDGIFKESAAYSEICVYRAGSDIVYNNWSPTEYSRQHNWVEVREGMETIFRHWEKWLSKKQFRTKVYSIIMQKVTNLIEESGGAAVTNKGLARVFDYISREVEKQTQECQKANNDIIRQLLDMEEELLRESTD
jgi:Glu-tRNA(Gln) amidotransferase subunit E-like FAD-binding protein